MTYEKKPKTSVWWPEIVDIETAQKAAKCGYWAAIWVAIVTAVFATIAIVTQKAIGSIDGSAYLDAVMFAFFAWRIKKYSRVFAVIGLVIFLLEKIMLMSMMTAGSWIQAAVMFLLFLHGIRGVFAYHRFLRLSKVTDGGILE